MARTQIRKIKLGSSRTDQRPGPALQDRPGFLLGIDHESIFWKEDKCRFKAIELDANSVLVMPESLLRPKDPEDVRAMETFDEDAWEGTEGCYKTTVIYEQMGEDHPHVVTFKGRDPWTAFPVLEKPSNLPLDAFMVKHKTTMYNAPPSALETRILPSHRPVAYQWALHLIDGISFAHAHDVILADFDTSQCWLSSDSHLTLSLAGFLHASFSYTIQSDRIVPASVPSNRSLFHPLIDGGDATKQTDLFVFGCVLFEIMTGVWPSRHFESRTWDEREAIVRQKEWPPLEEDYMGDIVRRCWSNQFDSAEQVKVALVSFVQDLGWEVDEKSNLKDLDASALFN